MIKRILRGLTIPLVILACVLFSPTAASAANNAYNTRDQRLTCLPTSDNHPSEVERRIYLAAGRYDLTQLMGRDGRDKVADNFYLGAGNYTWTDVIIPMDDFTYNHVTYLDPDNPDWGTARFEDTTFNWSISCLYDVFTWGSELDPQF